MCIRVVGYQVEKRRPGGDWQKVNDFPTSAESFTVPDLVEGDSYEFRVAAVTACGPGEFSLGTAPVVVKDKLGNYACKYSWLNN